MKKLLSYYIPTYNELLESFLRKRTRISYAFLIPSLIYFTAAQASNNAASETYIDYIITDAKLNVSYLIGPSYLPTNYLKNIGTGVAPNRPIGYFLSKDTLWDKSVDTLLAVSSTTGDIHPFYHYGTLYLPKNLPFGKYYILFVANHDRTVIEKDYSNNVAYVPIEVNPVSFDITIKSFSLNLPQKVVAGSAIDGINILKNVGNTAMDTVTTAYFLSNDTLYDKEDIYLSKSTFYLYYQAGLHPGEEFRQNVSFQLPLDTKESNYFIVAVTDYYNAYSEANEKNNLKSVPITILEPIVDVSVYDPKLNLDSLNVFDWVHATNRISNLGTYDVFGSSTQYFLSTDTILDSLDRYLGQADGVSLAGNGESQFQNASMQIPDVAEGRYYVLFVFDPLNSIAENNEYNNTKFVSIKVKRPFLLPIIDKSMDEGYSAFSIFPNPAVDNLMVGLPIAGEQELRYRVVNFTGSVVKSGTFVSANSERQSLAISDLCEGVYTLVITNGQRVSAREFIKR